MIGLFVRRKFGSLLLFEKILATISSSGKGEIC